MVRRSAQAGLILLLVGLLLGGAFFPAQAHARLVRSDPPDNAILPAAPEKVQLWFSEAITLDLSSARLLDLNGKEVTGLRIVADPAQPAGMLVELPALPDGVYSLNWKVFSAVDGHYNQGVLVFGVGAGADVAAAAASGEQGEQPAPWEVAARWLNYLGLAGLIGALGMWVICGFPLAGLITPGARIRRRLAGWMALCAALAWLAGWGLLAGQLQSAPSLEALLAVRWGGLWMARQMGLLLAVALAVWLRKNPVSPPFFLLLLLTLGVVALQALNSHAAGTPGDPLLPLLADGLHLVAVGLWAGGVLALLAVAWRPRLLDAALVRRFTPWAMLWVGLTTASGLFSSAQQVASLDALLFTPYGQALLVKGAVVLGVGALGFINMRIGENIEPGISTPGQSGNPPAVKSTFPWRFMALEGGLMLLVLVLTALLTSSAPANTIEYRLAGVQQPELLSQSVDDLLISFSARPNRPGQNILALRANSTRRPAPAEVQRVILRLRYLEQDLGQTILDAEALEGASGQYQAGGSFFSLPGRWQVEVVVRRKGLVDSVANFEWVVYPYGEMPALRVAAFPLAWLALPAAVLALLAGVVMTIRTRKKRPAGRG